MKEQSAKDRQVTSKEGSRKSCPIIDQDIS